MSATDELCKLLDERGVEYTTNKSDVYGFEVNTTRWGKHCFYERNTGEKLLESHDLTPEHVIAATLGRGTGEWVLEHSGTLYDKWRCSKCGYLFVEPRCDQGYTDLDPNFCPKCGVDFREEGDLIG